MGRPALKSGMVPLSNLLTFAIAAAVLIAVPGPSVLFVIGRALALGRKGGLLSVLGNALGMVPQIAAVALGVGVALAQSVLLFTILKFAGAAYLVYLGIQAIRHRGRTTTAAGPSRPASTFRVLREGFLVGATNPKSIVFFVAVLPQFVEYSAGAIPLQLATLGAVFLLIALVSDSVWALAAGTARQWFARSPKRVSTLGTTGGAMMIALGGTLALTGNKH
jgi:threonine/homoserine/homoserine lactone efflux protein